MLKKTLKYRLEDGSRSQVIKVWNRWQRVDLWRCFFKIKLSKSGDRIKMSKIMLWAKVYRTKFKMSSRIGMSPV